MCKEKFLTPSPYDKMLVFGPDKDNSLEILPCNALIGTLFAAGEDNLC
jgi:hypothetical protein